MPQIMPFMTQDHQRLESIFRNYQSALPQNPAEALQHFRKFREGLERHIVWEEDVLFPVFEDRTNTHAQGPTAVMRVEHERIKDLLARIQSALEQQKTDLADLDNDLLNILRGHNDKEEQILYPWIDQVLSDAERRGLFSRMGVDPESPDPPSP